MKKIGVLMLMLMLSAFARAGSNPNPADYTVKVHVSKSYIGTHGE